MLLDETPFDAVVVNSRQGLRESGDLSAEAAMLDRLFDMWSDMSPESGVGRDVLAASSRALPPTEVLKHYVQAMSDWRRMPGGSSLAPLVLMSARALGRVCSQAASVIETETGYPSSALAGALEGRYRAAHQIELEAETAMVERHNRIQAALAAEESYRSRVAGLEVELDKHVAAETAVRTRDAALDEREKQLDEREQEIQRSAAAEAGNAGESLAHHFKTLKEKENKIAKRFLIATFAALFVAIGVAIALLLADRLAAADAAEAIGHATLVLSLLAATAFLGRLSQQRRAVADWSEAIEVQLQTFQRFLGPIENTELRNRIYEDFARRVLGPPPTAGDATPGLPLERVLDIVTRNQSQG